jgi:hypothetical protein
MAGASRRAQGLRGGCAPEQRHARRGLAMLVLCCTWPVAGVTNDEGWNLNEPDRQPPGFALRLEVPAEVLAALIQQATGTGVAVHGADAQAGAAPGSPPSNPVRLTSAESASSPATAVSESGPSVFADPTQRTP